MYRCAHRGDCWALRDMQIMSAAAGVWATGYWLVYKTCALIKHKELNLRYRQLLSSDSNITNSGSTIFHNFISAVVLLSTAIFHSECGWAGCPQPPPPRDSTPVFFHPSLKSNSMHSWSSYFYPPDVIPTTGSTAAKHWSKQFFQNSSD